MAVTDLAGLARMAARLPEELQKAQRRGVSKGALIVTRGIRAEVRLATGGDSRMSNVGKRGARVGARYDVKGSAVNPTATIRATGPMPLLEHPVKPHLITPRKRRKGKHKALRFANGTFAAFAQHPGTRPKKPFEKGYLKTRDKTGPAFDKEVQVAIRKAMA